MAAALAALGSEVDHPVTVPDHVEIVLDQLVERGDTVVVVEHNLDLVRNADYLVDLGPEGGDAGGRLVAEGTPEQIAASRESWTGRFLAEAMAPASRKD